MVEALSRTMSHSLPIVELALVRFDITWGIFPLLGSHNHTYYYWPHPQEGLSFDFRCVLPSGGPSGLVECLEFKGS